MCNVSRSRTKNKTYYNIKCVELNDNNEPTSEKFFKTMKECGSYYNCSTRLIGYMLQDINKTSKKLQKVKLYKCKEPIQYLPPIEMDISKDLSNVVEPVVEPVVEQVD